MRLALVAAACACGPATPSGTGEPFAVRGAQFVVGPLPVGTGPVVTHVAAQSPIVLPGQGGKQLEGRASDRASAVALALEGVGTGYWVVPLRAPDPQHPGELTWGVTCDFARAPGAGTRHLQLAAIDEHGAAGPRAELALCFAGDGSDGRRACDPSKTRAPGGVVLEWDADVDLDLVVVGPDGASYGAKSPAGGLAHVDRDALARCAPDPRRREELVFTAAPRGTFRFYVSLVDACGRAGATFTVRARAARGDADVELFAQGGRVSAHDAWGGRAPALFVGEATF